MTIQLWDIALLLLGAKIGGSVFSKLQQPSLIGELLAGVIMGSVLHIVSYSTTIEIVSNLGAMFLILLTMMSIDFSRINRDVEKLVVAQIISAAVIFLMLFGLFEFLGLEQNLTLAIAAAIFGSSTAITARTLMTMDVMNSKEGQAIIGLQIINGIIELLLISAVLNVFQYNQLNIEPIMKLSLMIIGTFAVMSRVGGRFINWVFDSAQKFKMEEVLLAFTLVLAFTTAGIVEKAGMSNFLGIMLIGMLISRAPQALTISQKIKELGESFFIPIFFASLGLGVSLVSIAESLPIFLLLFGSIVVIRLASFVAPMLFLEYSLVESLKISSGMSSMSEYGLLMLSLGAGLGIINNTFYSIFVAIFLMLNLLSPFMIKMFFNIESPKYRKSWGKKKWFSLRK